MVDNIAYCSYKAIGKSRHTFKRFVKVDHNILFTIIYKYMEEKDKIIATLRQQLKEAVSRCNALEQENALLSYQLEKKGERKCPALP